MTPPELSSLRKINRIVDTAHHSLSADFSVSRLTADMLPEAMDPFLAYDHFQMGKPFFPPHPHAGFSAVTYILPESATGFLNRDSRGDHRIISPGSLHWVAAGSGVIHEEVPAEPQRIASGVQVFVNLASGQKFMEPQILHLKNEEVPVVREEGGEVRVLAGSHRGTSSPLTLPTPVTFLEVGLVEGALFTTSVPVDEDRFIYVISGEGSLGETPIGTGQAGSFRRKGEEVQVRAGASGMRFLLAGGRPLGEPILFHGPFCMNTPSQIQRAIADYQAGRMGALERSF